MNSLPIISHRLFAAAVREDDLRRARPAPPVPGPALELEAALGPDGSRPDDPRSDTDRPFPIPAVRLDC